jgi:hypothetical protein
MRYFSCLYRLNGEARYLIWIGDEQDSVAVDAGGFIPTFKDPLPLRRYADLNHYSLESEEPTLIDLDRVAIWMKSPTEPVNCEEVLVAWNLFIDVAASVGDSGIAFERLDSQTLAIYHKIFAGNNLPAITPKGCHYVPEWSPDEIASLAEILSTGLDMFASCTRGWPQEA